jgi:hypothetical protein
MASYVFGALGTALGGPIGGIIGAMIGGLIDRQVMMALTPNTTTNVTSTGPRVTEMSVTSSTEGTVLPKLFGRVRLGGQVIWCTQFKEVAETTTTSQSQGGKGGGGEQTQTTTTAVYKYYLSFAVAFCAGNSMASIGRVWLDSNLADLSKYTWRFYPGSQYQPADTLIQAKEGVGATPAYRGTAYIVFEDMPLEDFGNRMPQVTAEIVVPLETDDPDDLSNAGRAYQLIPGSGESILGTQVYTDQQGYINWHGVYTSTASNPDNMHNNMRQPDNVVSLNQLFAEQPNLDAVSVVITWYGTDLRAGECRIIPKVESYDRHTVAQSDLAVFNYWAALGFVDYARELFDWKVAGYTRSTAELVSRDAQDRPIFGGTPSDATVRETIRYLKAAGKRVILYPFIIMDIPGGNSLPNPYSDNAAGSGQAVFPWRGRITCSPAAGYAGTADKTGTAATQINTFFERTEGFRAMILHYAQIAQEEGADAMTIGSEMVGLTTVRSSAGDGTYPAVDQFCALADDVNGIFSGQITYAADWSEYHSHRPADGTGDVIFNMDKLWGRASIDFVGIDNYLPMSDWRDGSGHLDYDAVNGPRTLFDRDYLKSQIEGGEYYDYYYASSGDRDNQVRTPIVDGNPANEPWIYRQKDMRNWWANAHYSRPGGVRNGSPTDWGGHEKPIWFTEFGCPAVDKGTNQPNVFYDPKSSESFFPYYSKGVRDDFIQRVYLECMLSYWRDNAPTIGGVKMVRPQDMFIWTWDSRPFPEYPMRSDVWADYGLWPFGHWLTGRIESAVLARLVRKLCLEVGLEDSQIDVSGLYGPGALVRGMFLNNSSDQRSIIESLSQAFQFGAFESEGKLKFVLGLNTVTVDVDQDDLVLKDGQNFAVSITRAQEIDLPRAAKVTFLDELNAYSTASVDGQKGTGSSVNVTTASFPIVMAPDYARSLANSLIHRAWVARESGEFALPPSYAKFEAGDAMFLPVGNRTIGVQAQQINTGTDRTVTFQGFDTSLFTAPAFPQDTRLPLVDNVFSSIRMMFLDIPILSAAEPLQHAPRLAASASPWPGACAVYKDDGAGGFSLLQNVYGRATIGELNTDLYSGPTNRWDRVTKVRVKLLTGGLSTVTPNQILSGSVNAFAVQNQDNGKWEVIQFANANLVSPGIYELSMLLRGQLSTADAMGAPFVPAGAPLAMLDPALVSALNVGPDIAPLPILYRWGPAQYAPTDAGYLQATHQGTKAGLRPYTPCDAWVRRDSATDDLLLSWKRRTRLSGDNWEQTEVPLIEEAEQYQLQIYTDDGVTLKRTEVLTTPSYLYTAANQVADFGSVQRDVFLRISQWGAAYGNYGPPLEGHFFMRSAA